MLKAYAVKTGLNSFSDFDELWIGAKALLAGQSPYAAVAAQSKRWPLFYPVHAVVAHVPLTFFTLEHARIAYIGVSAFAFALAITRDGWHRWPALLSAAFLVAIANGQWSPLLVAGVIFPWMSFLTASKPTSGGALLLAYFPELIRRRGFWLGIAIAIALAIVGTIIDPDWWREWLATMPNTPQITAPVMYVPWLGVAIVVLACLRWRRPEARLIALLAVVPQSFRVYELLPLFLVPTTRTQAIVLAIGTWVSEVAGGYVSDLPVATIYQQRHALWYLLFAYLPCVLMVLRRPNEGVLPRPIHVAAAYLPGWLRGRSPPLERDAR